MFVRASLFVAVSPSACGPVRSPHTDHVDGRSIRHSTEDHAARLDARSLLLRSADW